MRFAYADPPYFGCCGLYKHHHPDGLCWDDEATHARLIQRLCRDFPDGWVLSGSAPSLRMLLDHCPDDDMRIGIWVKPFASFKPHVTPAHAWEPVIFTGGRRKLRTEWSGRDWISAMPPLFSGETTDKTLGMKPEAFCWWVFRDLLGMQADDELLDLFPGSGVIGRTLAQFQRQGTLCLTP